ADHLSIFDEVIASDGRNNLGGAAKAAALVERFGSKGFIYAGNASTDVAVWREAAASVVVAAPRRVGAAAAAAAPVVQSLAREDSMLRGLVRALRPHQWVKNLLVFVPLVCAAAFDNIGSWEAALECFLGFCAIASAIYLLNDIADLASDRAHPRKSRRPFARGAVPISL